VPYEIDILAPAPMVIQALDWVRRNYDCKEMSSTMCNLKWGKLVGIAVAKKFSTTPHRLRGVNAVACEHIYNVGDDKKSFMGYLKDHLGHSNPHQRRYINVSMQRLLSRGLIPRRLRNQLPRKKRKKKLKKLRNRTLAWYHIRNQLATRLIKLL